MIDFEEAFKTDCIESRGYSEQEAERLWRDVGEDFVEEMLSDLWDNWSENFPIGEKDKIIRNINEAISQVGITYNMTPEEIIDNEIVMEVQAEEGEGFVVWVHSDGHIAKEGEPIGFDTIDGTSVIFTPYSQYTDQDEG